MIGKKKQKVIVGMSGGVDSSVSAALLKQAGYDVTGAFIKVWSPDWLPCTWKEERRDAMRVAAVLNIPFITIDLQKEYKNAVVDYMLDEYKRGRTPNPDVMCNKEIKFGSFLRKALEMGADYIATGHYAQNVLNTNTDLCELKEGRDKNKDQSYFLWTLTQSELKHVLFPVGNLEKSEVRKLAKKFKLPTADKKDSQGICFIGKVEMKEFLSHYIDIKEGEVINESGTVIGSHGGAVFYTVGERHGFEIFNKTPHDKPYYITTKDVMSNKLVVSNRNAVIGQSVQASREVILSDINWVAGEPDVSKKYEARLRYRQARQSCRVNENKILFDTKQESVSPGQSVVVYDKEICLGGGIVAEVR